ncbi:MAG: LacI family DNA-binding transcriptional regulator [Pontiella sp.]
MATIYDVAKQAGVSVATVSRILNGERNVTPKTTMIVEAAIKQVGYVPRAVRPGRKPVNRKGVQTGMIDFLSLGATPPAQLFRLPAFSRLLDGIMQSIEERGMDLVLSHCPKGEVIPPVLARRRADGVLIFGEPALYAKVASVLDRIPHVWCFLADGVSGEGLDHVVYDNSHVGEIAADYLIGRGHRRIAYMSVGSDHVAFNERRAIFVDSLAAKGVLPVVIEGNVERLQNMACDAEPIVEQLLAMDPLPSGVFLAADDLMLAVFNGLRRRGIDPGKDIELIGCNNDRLLMDQMHPRPATIDLQLNRVGLLAMEHLVEKMAHTARGDSVAVHVSSMLIPAEK